MTGNTHTLTLPFVEGATRSFIRAERMREVVSLALVSGLNPLFSGPGGHGKSEFYNSVLSAITGTEPFVKSFGQGTTPEDLFGNIDFKKLRDEIDPAMEYDTSRSFMASKIAVFEEMFDAPARLLMSLKDILTSKQFRNGAQQVRSATSIVMAATNWSPTEIAKGGQSIAALVERFPIQLEVKWDSYTEDDFFELFSTEEPEHKPSISWAELELMQKLTREVQIDTMVLRVLAYVCQELCDDGVTISPRSAKMALRMVAAAAVINNRDTAIADDIIAIQYLPGCQDKRQQIFMLIQEKREELRDLLTLEEVEKEIQLVRKRFSNQLPLSELKILHDTVFQLEIKLGSVVLPIGSPQYSSLFDRRENAGQDCNELRRQIQQAMTLHDLPKFEAEFELRKNTLFNTLRKAKKNRNLTRALEAELAVLQLGQEVQEMNKAKKALTGNGLRIEITKAMTTLTSYTNEVISTLRNSNNGWVHHNNNGLGY
jgi:MoxR-like ATPase